MQFLKGLSIIGSLLLITMPVYSQILQVSAITIDGNEKTKARTILRELDFTVGDTIEQTELSTRLEQNRNNLLRTGLFTDVALNIEEWMTDEKTVSVGISVSESWYIFPMPLFELADRNFNVWWTEQNRSLSRVNIGMRLYLLNLNGINDQLKFKVQVGYTPKFEATYKTPFVNRAQTIGLEINFLRSVNKEIPLLNIDNKQVFFDKDDETIFRRSRIRLGASYRPSLYTSHRLLLEYHNHSIDEELVQETNPDFFLEDRERQEFLALEYELLYDRRDRSIFPTTGWYAGMNVVKEGLGVGSDLNTLAVRPFVHRHFALSDAITLGVALHGKWSLLREQVPYYNYRGLGFLDDFLRGYELYVVDGLDFFYSKSSIAFQLVNSTINWKRKMPISSFRVMPWQLYVSLNYDLGYVNDPFYTEANSFTNRWLHGGGFGINLMLYNLFVFQIEVSANHLGEKGLFLHTKTSF